MVVPGTVGFVGAFLAFVGVFEAAPALALLAAVGLLAASAAGFTLYSKVVLGPLETEAMRRMTDLTAREKLSVAPLVALVVVFGIFPRRPAQDRSSTQACLPSKARRAMR